MATLSRDAFIQHIFIENLIMTTWCIPGSGSEFTDMTGIQGTRLGYLLSSEIEKAP
jgi:hypothetical protein